MPSKLPQLNVRLKPAIYDLVLRLCEESGLSQAAVVSQAVRLLARREGVASAPKKNPKKSPGPP